jgi:hypothetical protein
LVDCGFYRANLLKQVANQHSTINMSAEH